MSYYTENLSLDFWVDIENCIINILGLRTNIIIVRRRKIISNDYFTNGNDF